MVDQGYLSIIKPSSNAWSYLGCVAVDGLLATDDQSHLFLLGKSQNGLSDNFAGGKSVSATKCAVA